MNQNQPLIKVGSHIPSVQLQLRSPNETVDSREYFKKFNRSVLIGVPGAFTPGCDATHLPSFVKSQDELKKLGVESIACVTVNDAFVAQKWKQHSNADQIEMFADPRAEFVSQMGLSFDATRVLGNVRSKRFAMLLEKDKVVWLNVEPDNGGLTCTLASHVIDQLKKQLQK